jgi:hypothetical protein
VNVELEVVPVEMELVDDEREVDEAETDETDETEETDEVETVDEDTVPDETLVELEDGATELEDTTAGIESDPGVYLVRS